MRILFSCSRDHFDPQARTNLTRGASWIARGIYEACRELGDVTHMDPSEASLVEDQRFDLLIGEGNSFETICRRLRPRRSILFMATTHPENRNRVVKSEAKRTGCASLRDDLGGVGRNPKLRGPHPPRRGRRGAASIDQGRSSTGHAF